MSAKQDKNIQEGFYFIGKEIKEKVLSGDEAVFAKTFNRGTKINGKEEVKTKKSDCC